MTVLTYGGTAHRVAAAPRQLPTSNFQSHVDEHPIPNTQPARLRDWELEVGSFYSLAVGSWKLEVIRALYTVYTMKRGAAGGSTVVTVRVSTALERKLSREARRRRRTRSETARALLEAALEAAPDDDPVAEARRQSRLASRQASEKEVLQFIADAADLRGWE